ncbi:MAG: hypothetical protein INH41_31170 [Myxococcaceae bacterium]|jgi:hypothetical protein|nr:hypothetical protein [Myxococcaceae bacterium]MCA3016869.1 hypothetical protein [Myxococcaceae bacterium]
MRRAGPIVMLLFGTTACPPPPDVPDASTPPPCSPRTCEGCCAFDDATPGGTCVGGAEATACGAGGRACEACASAEACVRGFCRGPDEPAPPGARVVFVTSATFTGDLGGLAGADARCGALAADAGLPGRFLAFLSTVGDGGLAAPDRFSGAAPWVLLTRDARGKLLTPFPSADALRGPPRSPVDQDEAGRVLFLGDKRQVWTGTLLDGGLDAPRPDRDTTCGDWTTSRTTGLYGIIDVPTDKWSGLGAIACASDNRLYCFQQ